MRAGQRFFEAYPEVDVAGVLETSQDMDQGAHLLRALREVEQSESALASDGQPDEDHILPEDKEDERYRGPTSRSSNEISALLGGAREGERDHVTASTDQSGSSPS